VKRYIHHDILISLCLIIFSLVFLATSFSFPTDSGMFPRCFIYFLLVLSCVVLYQSLKVSLDINKRIKDGENIKSELTIDVMKLPFQGFLIIFIYIVSIYFLGFFTSTTIFMVVFMLFLRVKNLKYILLSTLATNIFIYVLFFIQLKLILPKGIFF
jgi:hypothetical protein